MSDHWGYQLAWNLSVLALKILCLRKSFTLGKLECLVTVIINQVPAIGN